MRDGATQEVRQVRVDRFKEGGELRIPGVALAQAAQDFRRRFVESAHVLGPAADSGLHRGVTPASLASCFTV